MIRSVNNQLTRLLNFSQRPLSKCPLPTSHSLTSIKIINDVLRHGEKPVYLGAALMVSFEIICPKFHVAR